MIASMRSSKINSAAFTYTLATAIAMGVCCIAFAEPRAEDHSIFKQLFDQKIERVQETRETGDDAELIKEMQEAADSIPDSPEVQRLIYRAMIDLASSSRQYLSAAAAIDQLNAQFPDDPAANPDKALLLLEKGYRSSRRENRKEVGELYVARLVQRADRLAKSQALSEASQEYRRARLIARDIDSSAFDQIQVSIDRIDRRIKTDRKITELKAAIEADPSKTAIARELTLLLMLDQDDPAQAYRYAKLTEDTELTEATRLASAELALLETDEMIRVADWYDKQSNKGGHDDEVLERLLTKVVNYCELILSQYTQRDAKRLRLTAMNERAAQRLAEFNAAEVVTDKFAEWTDLLKAFDVKKHALGKQIKKADGQIRTIESDFILQVSPNAGYDLRLDFTFVGGKAGLNFALPIGKGHFTMLYSRYSHTQTGIKGTKIIKAESAMLKPGQKVNLQIRVRQLADRNAAVQFLIDNEVAVDWEGPATKLASNYADDLDSLGRSIRVQCGGEFLFDQILYREVASD